MELVTVSKRIGHFDWAHENNEQIYYRFLGVPAPKGNPGFDFGFMLENISENDYELPGLDYTPLQFAKDIRRIVRWNKDRLDYIIKYLEENNKEQTKLWYENQLEWLRKEKKNLEDRVKQNNWLISEFESWLNEEPES